MSPSFTYEVGTSLDRDGDTKVSLEILIIHVKTLFLGVPSHTGIRGTKRANSTAKSALELPHAKVGVPYTDFKHHINQYILS